MFKVICALIFLNFAQTSSVYYTEKGFFKTTMGSSHYYPRIIWCYWEDESTMQEDVEEMINVTKRSVSNYFTYNFVTYMNLSRYLDISSFPTFYPKLITAHKSDYIRLRLIEKYGGMYVDASTFITSGSSMERFFKQGVDANVELWGFKFAIPNFMGGAQDSTLLSRYRKKFDEFLSRDFYQYCKDERLQDTYTCTDHIFEDFFGENYSPQRILVLPTEGGHYRLLDECENKLACVRDRLQYDPEVRKHAFIKLTHGFRTGKKVNFLESIRERDKCPSN